MQYMIHVCELQFPYYAIEHKGFLLLCPGASYRFLPHNCAQSLVMTNSIQNEYLFLTFEYVKIWKYSLLRAVLFHLVTTNPICLAKNVTVSLFFRAK